MSDYVGLLAELVPQTPRFIPDWQWNLTVVSVGLFFAAEVGFAYGTRTGVIARATAKEAIRQPLYVLLLVLGALLLCVNTILPFFSQIGRAHV